VNKILIIDDDDDVRRLVSKTLEAEGFIVDTAPNGREALALLRNETEPRLILLDLLMPIMSGWQFRAAQAQDPLLARCPVVVISATSSLEEAAIHADGLITKPVQLDLLVETVRSFADAHAFDHAPTTTPDARVRFDGSDDGVVFQEMKLDDSNPPC
jgi:CheY-like chemotaxis protein